MSTQAIWYAERAAGVVSYVLVTALVVLGLTLSNRWRSRRWPMFAIEDVHRFVGILAGVFIALHVSLLAVDSFLPFSVPQLLVPFSAGYRPLATGLGTVALELLVAVAIANALRRRISHRTWRGIHYAGFGVWVAATAHGLLAGSDRHDSWLLAVYLVSVAAVLAALVFRVSATRTDAGRALGVGVAGAAVVVGVLALLPVSASPSKANAAGRSLPNAYHGTLTAQVEQQRGAQASLLSVVGSSTGRRTALVRIDLLGNALGVEQTSLQITFPGTQTCVGTVTRLDNQGFSGRCSTADGEQRSVTADWRVSADSVTGSLALT